MPAPTPGDPDAAKIPAAPPPHDNAAAGLPADSRSAADLRAILRDELPDVTEEQLEAIGHKTLTALAIHREDAKTFLQLRTARAEAAFERQRLAFRERDAAREDAAHELARQKFQRDTCDLFLKWNENLRAKEIAAGPADNAAKIEALGRIMFGETWREPAPGLPIPSSEADIRFPQTPDAAH